MHVARISLLLAGCALAAAAACDRAVKMHAYRNIDAYLRATIERCSSEAEFVARIVQSLMVASDAVQVVADVPGTRRFAEPGLSALTRHRVSPASLHPILGDLLLAATSCEQQHTDFLHAIAEYET